MCSCTSFKIYFCCFKFCVCVSGFVHLSGVLAGPCAIMWSTAQVLLLVRSCVSADLSHRPCWGSWGFSARAAADVGSGILSILFLWNIKCSVSLLIQCHTVTLGLLIVLSCRPSHPFSHSLTCGTPVSSILIKDLKEPCFLHTFLQPHLPAR